MSTLDKEIERTEQRLMELREQKRLLANDEERLQREVAERKVAKCDNCGYAFIIPEGHGIIGPDGETMDCPKCKKGTMRDHNL